jgi:hypothetical protein
MPYLLNYLKLFLQYILNTEFFILSREFVKCIILYALVDLPRRRICNKIKIIRQMKGNLRRSAGNTGSESVLGHLIMQLQM